MNLSDLIAITLANNMFCSQKCPAGGTQIVTVGDKACMFGHTGVVTESVPLLRCVASPV